MKYLIQQKLVIGIAIPGELHTRKEIDKLVDWVRRPQVGAKGMVYVKCNEDGTYKSSVDKFYDQEDLGQMGEATGCKAGDLNLHSIRGKEPTRRQLKCLENGNGRTPWA